MPLLVWDRILQVLGRMTSKPVHELRVMSCRAGGCGGSLLHTGSPWWVLGRQCWTRCSLLREGTDSDQTTMKTTGSSSRMAVLHRLPCVCPRVCPCGEGPGPWAGLLRRESQAGIWVRVVCQEEKARETAGAGQRVRGRDPGTARVLGASRGALRGSETCPGLTRAGGSRWTPATPRDLRVCVHGPRTSQRLEDPSW